MRCSSLPCSAELSLRRRLRCSEEGMPSWPPHPPPIHPPTFTLTLMVVSAGNQWTGAIFSAVTHSLSRQGQVQTDISFSALLLYCVTPPPPSPPHPPLSFLPHTKHHAMWHCSLLTACFLLFFYCLTYFMWFLFQDYLSTSPALACYANDDNTAESQTRRWKLLLRDSGLDSEAVWVTRHPVALMAASMSACTQWPRLQREHGRIQSLPFYQGSVSLSKDGDNGNAAKHRLC